ncbi:MAG: HAMP domain-containing sensor histidine kinase [Eubacteriales bacterium]|nr:HAMP domain-containing sensor histidine kinase [Eubacteriales bacterium]
MAKNDVVPSMRKYIIQLVILVTALAIVINALYMSMTWLATEIAKINDVYLRAEFQFLGTLVIVLLILIIIFAVIYRRRKRELTTLSESIRKVANGDFSAKITYNKSDSMAHVYRDFNKMSAELESVQVLRKDFINNYSHEFKTPIASINGFASLLLDKELPEEDQRTYLKIIQEESERLSNLTSNTILLSKLSSQKIVSDTECYDLGEQLRQCAIILSHEWLKKQQTFSGEFPHIDYVGNRELMKHLWINLISNAVKYTPPGGEISVRLSRQDSQIVVTVTDTGKGMDKKTLSHLFDPYYQGDRSHSNQGLGLGLSIAKQIIELCSGSIHVKSAVDEGSEFIVYLPSPAETKPVHSFRKSR